MDYLKLYRDVSRMCGGNEPVDYHADTANYARFLASIFKTNALLKLQLEPDANNIFQCAKDVLASGVLIGVLSRIENETGYEKIDTPDELTDALKNASVELNQYLYLYSHVRGWQGCL